MSTNSINKTFNSSNALINVSKFGLLNLIKIKSIMTLNLPLVNKYYEVNKVNTPMNNTKIVLNKKECLNLEKWEKKVFPTK